jgi:large subunit ribosomal protein L23
MRIILQKPLLTEKTTKFHTNNVYGFIVDKKANKVEIKKTVEALYGVTILQINTMCYAGKKKTKYRRSSVVSGKRASFKKAFVTVKKGDTIDLYTN